jgi:hypothetical protein
MKGSLSSSTKRLPAVVSARLYGLAFPYRIRTIYLLKRYINSQLIAYAMFDTKKKTFLII